jgi:ubiquitin-protein ligase
MSAALKRLAREVNAFKDSDDFAIRVINDNLRTLQLFIAGPADSPYADAIFSFTISVPDNYPFNPPAVKLTSTDGGRVRLNPNLYSNGKVCVTVLNTWSVSASDANCNGWTPALSFFTVAASIQSLLTADPLHNEPGFEQCEFPAAQAESSVSRVKRCYHHSARVENCCAYSVKIRHEAIRLGIVQPLIAALTSASVSSKRLRLLTDLWRRQASMLSRSTSTSPGPSLIHVIDMLRVCIGDGAATDPTVVQAYAAAVLKRFTNDRLSTIATECEELANIVDGKMPALCRFEQPDNGLQLGEKGLQYAELGRIVRTLQTLIVTVDAAGGEADDVVSEGPSASEPQLNVKAEAEQPSLRNPLSDQTSRIGALRLAVGVAVAIVAVTAVFRAVAKSTVTVM